MIDDSDSSSDDEVVNFKRGKRKRSKDEEEEDARPKPDLSKLRARSERFAATPSLPTLSAGCNGSLGHSAVKSGMRYVDRDAPEGDLSVPPGAGRRLTSSFMSRTNGSCNGNQTVAVAVARTSQVSVEAPKPLSGLEIIKAMGFQRGRGIAKYMENEQPLEDPFSFEEFEESVSKLGVYVPEENLMTPKVNEQIVVEEIKWLRCPPTPTPASLEVLQNGRVLGPTITNVEIDKDNAFINPALYSELIECKKLFRNLTDLMYNEIRGKANLFEAIGRGPFQCRAALKMANLDAIMNFELTQPKLPNGMPSGQNSLFHFADVCAGPGGFSEYVLWRKKWEAKGYGFTLKGELDFDLKNFISETETFEPFYGSAGDGNVYNPTNVAEFIELIFRNTGSGVNLMMADGGFTVSKKEYLQEPLSHQIILSQVFIALAIVKPGGCFVCKLFDVVTPFTVGLIYFLYRSFDTVAIHKPVTSRPANSERYVLCKWKKSSEIVLPFAQFLGECHRMMWKNLQEGSESSIVQLVPMDNLKSADDPFYRYILETNNRLCRKQIDSLKRIVPFVRNSGLSTSGLQEKVKKLAMDYWKVPEKIQIPRMVKTCDNACHLILDDLPLTMLKCTEKDLDRETADVFFKSPFDWRFVPVTGYKTIPNRGFYMSLGQELVYRYTGSQWVMVAPKEPLLHLPSKTMVYGEFGHEIYGRGASDQKVIDVFHIIDALSLGGIDLRLMHYTQRNEMCVKFARAVSKPGTLLVRAKVPIRMEEFPTFIKRLENMVVRGAGHGAQRVCPMDMNHHDSPYIMPQGLLFLKITKDPWQMALNKQSNKKYFFNTLTGIASDMIPEEAVSGFFHTMCHRVLWTWDKETDVTNVKLEADDARLRSLSPSRIHAYSLTDCIKKAVNMPPAVSPPHARIQNHGSTTKTDQTNGA